MNLALWQQGGKEFTWNGHRLFVRAEGQGRALLLIHGFPTSSYDWHELWPMLLPHYQLHSIDMLGFGLSDKPKNYAYTLFASADQWQEYVCAQGLSDVEIVAHDYGDTVAQELLARQLEGRLPFRIHKVSLLNGGIFPEATFPILMQKLLRSKVGPLVARLSNVRSFTSSMRKICSAPLSDAHLQAHWQLLARADGKWVLPKIIQYMHERRVHRARWVLALQNANIPLCLINGVEDPISGASIVKRWRELLPNSTAHELPNIGHYPQWECPEKVFEVLLQ